jgi:hypothetical protein
MDDNELLQFTHLKLKIANLIYNRHHLLHTQIQPPSHLKESLQEIINDRLNFPFQFLRKSSLRGNLVKQTPFIGSQMSKEFSFIFRNTINGDFIKILPCQNSFINWGRGKYSFNTRVNEGDLFLDGERGVLSLFQKFLEAFTTVESLFCGCVEIGSELSKGCDFTVLS